MQRNSLLWMMATAVVLIVSCGRADKAAVSVPKNAAIVFHINSPSLSSKLSWKEIQASSWFKEAYAEADDSLAKKLLDNPENSGIDVQGDLVFFLEARGTRGYAAFQGTLKDAAAFEAFNKKMKPSATTSKSGGVTVITLEKEAIAVYKGDHFVYLFNAPFAAQINPMGGGRGEAYTTDSLIAIAQSLYDLKGDASLTSDDRYASLIKEKGDFHFWVNAEGLYGNMANAGPLAMLNFGKLINGNISAATVNFENGKIDVTSKGYYNKEMAAFYEKYKMKKIDADVLSRIPSENVSGVFVMNYPPEGLKEFLKILGADGMVNGFLGKVQYSIDEFVKANKGDLVVAVSDFEIKSEQVTYPSYEEGGQPYTYNKTTPSAKILFAVSVNDKPAFDKLIGVVGAQLGETAQQMAPQVKYAVNDKWFAAGNSEEQVNKFVAGGANSKQPYISKLAGHPAGMYIDLQKVLKVVDTTVTGEREKIVAQESLKTWEDILFTAGELSNGSMSSHFEINMVDKNTNSLKQLNQYIDKVAATKKKGF